MDLKIKSKAWVGSIFDGVRQDFDEFMSQDTVKFVENQVQTIGVGVKKLYSDVQDLLPLVDPVESKVQVKTKKQNDAIGTYIRSMVGIKEKSLCVVGGKPTREANVLDLSEHCSPSISCEPDHEGHFLDSPGAIFSEEAETDLAMEDNNGDAVIETPDISIDKNVTSEEPPVAQNAISSESSQTSSVNYHINTMLHEVSSPTSLHDSRFESPQEDKTICNSSSNEIECISSISRDKSVASEEPIFAQNISSSEDRIFSSSSLNSSDHYHMNTTLDEVSLSTSLHDSGFKSRQDSTILNSPSDEIECVHSNISRDKEVLSTELFHMSESSTANFTQNAENLCRNHTDTVVHASNVLKFPFSSSVPTLASDNKDVGVFPTISRSSFSSLSNGKVDDPSEDVADPGMETIDLSDKPKVNESCITVENRLVFPASNRARSFGSYKKLLKDAFTVRKRLTKEYEQLAIWYGDIDAEASQHFGSHPSPDATSIQSQKSTTHDTWESEWELL